MYTRPDDLRDATVLESVRQGWDIAASAVEYRPVGFGSHHWTVSGAGEITGFATVDDLRGAGGSSDDEFARLDAALSTAFAVRKSGATFVVAPVPRVDGSVLGRIDDRYALAVYPYIEGAAHQFGEELAPGARMQVLDMVLALHACEDSARRQARVDPFTVPARDELMRALQDLSQPWYGGPFGERTRALLTRRGSLLARWLDRHDVLVDGARRRPERMVLTHGEPHPGNLIETVDGWALIDWETALMAPPERDLWLLEPGDGSITAAYTDRSGTPVLPEMLALYRLSWALTDVALFVAQFRAPHDEDDDAAVAWNGLLHTLDGAR